LALDDDIALLARVPMLGSIEKEALRLLAFSAEPRVLRAGDVLFRKNDPADGGFVVASGAVTLLADDEVTPLAVAEAGSLLGEIALISETRRPATAIAREPTTVLRLARVLFRRTLEEYPHVAERIAREIHARMVATTSGLAEVKHKLDRIG
jgi:CRP-like cAMP-binding protein